MVALAKSLPDENRQAGAMWSLGGAAYDDVSYRIADAIAHAAQRLDAKPGEKVLDIATGTGWAARNAARSGADVTGVDIAEGLLAAARDLTPPGRSIAYRHGDAEALPFGEGAFDAVISTFGIMFAADQKRAAGELARVCRPGGRIAIAAWTPDGAVGRFFGIIGKYSDAPRPDASPMAWGTPDHAEALLGKNFALGFEPGIANSYHPDPDDMWTMFENGFGPFRQLVASLDEERLARFREDVDAYHEHYRTPNGLHVKREYLLVLGKRRGSAA